MRETGQGLPDHPGLGPVASRRTIQEEVYQRLSHALMTGWFDPGQILTISSLSELFGTSHMPVREALRRLTAEKALEVVSTGSACVPTVSRARLNDLCNTRVIVEGAATELAAPHITSRDLRTLERAAADHAQAEDGVYAMMARNQEFHFTIYRASQSPVLIQLIEALWLRFGPYLRMLTRHMEPLLKTTDSRIYTQHHYAIIAALKKNDTAAAKAHLIEDIKTTQALLQTLCPADDQKSSVA
ncbi:MULTISPECIES: GntR family transcriptional regulator [unclassified Chelatococcus]|uniref:GntR family transcriptional regulator n=1 Tax=unclassified Chelatococcus TaxID=2638111 RepID=UPI0025C6FC1F|nr:GntR family transcriptional regulator [Chelatococcus sp.]